MTMFGIPAEYYKYIYLISISLLSIVAGTKIASKQGTAVINTKVSMPILPLYVLFLIFLIGFRPLSPLFGDTVIYARLYDSPETFDDDWLFAWFQGIASKTIDVRLFFFIITVGYFVPVWIACRRLVRNNSDILLLFVIGAFSFYGYAVNGIRNGLACSFVILALSYLGDKRKIPFILFSFIAIGIHKACFLPTACAVFSFYYRKPEMMFYFWLLSIPISLVAGPQIGAFLGGLGFDDRMASYTSQDNMEEFAELFSHTGFRWDFLLYSSMPVLLGWYTIFKRGISDSFYYSLLSTYVYSNAFWILVIYSVSSNRFAYLSWFLYPIVLAYPLLKFPVFKQSHSRKTAAIFILQLLFTVVMLIRG